DKFGSGEGNSGSSGCGSSYPELEELADLDQVINGIVREYGSGEMVFIDLHTTSSDSCPLPVTIICIPAKPVAPAFQFPIQFI
ncbi:MAG: hypothetical protein WD426_04910, partial [Anditalea sp.]